LGDIFLSVPGEGGIVYSLIMNLHRKLGLHYGDYCSKLMPFEDKKNIFYFFKRL
jgi:hypothetical protein